jgi:hypothetical protein
LRMFWMAAFMMRGLALARAGGKLRRPGVGRVRRFSP